MKKFAVFIVAIILSLVLFKTLDSNPKVGVINMDELMYEFNGTKEASQAFEAKINSWNQEIEKIESNIKNIYETMRMDSLDKNTGHHKGEIKKIKLLSQNRQKLKYELDVKSQEHDYKVTKGILTQLKEYQVKYAKENSYDLILTSVNGENVGFYSESVDITKELIDYSNKAFENE